MMGENRFNTLLSNLASSVEDDYREAREHARASDPQRSGHEGESTWQRLIEQWGPGWAVVTRKYIVGPGGASNEVDVVLLKPDYPAHLRGEASILVSGVAAAFSSKLTLRRAHIAEAIEQKKQLLKVANHSDGDIQSVLVGPFPFGLLAHSSTLVPKEDDVATQVQLMYEELVHWTDTPLTASPQEELDALLIADQAFLSTTRLSLAPPVVPEGSLAEWSPMTTLTKHPNEIHHPGAPLAQFMTWLNGKCVKSGPSLSAFREMFDASMSSGYMRSWPMDVYPAYLRASRAELLNPYGNPLTV